MSIEIVPPFKVISRIFEGAIWDPDEISLRRLRDIVAGKDTTFPRARAMELFLTCDFPNKHRDFEAVLINDEESPDIRYLAAIYLGKINTPAALEILIQNSRIQDEFVLAGIMKALGGIGDRSALKTVSMVKDEGKGVAASEAKFAAALISYRLGIQGNDLEMPTKREFLKFPASCARPLQINQADSSDAEFCLRSVSYQPLGIEFAEHPMYQVRCGRDDLMILFNRDCLKQRAAQRLMKNKALLGAIAKRDEESKHYSVAFLMLTSPGEEKNIINIFICRTNGNLIFGGLAQVKNDRAAFSIQAFARPGAFALELAGNFENGRLEIEKALATPLAQIKKRQAKEEASERPL